MDSENLTRFSENSLERPLSFADFEISQKIWTLILKIKCFKKSIKISEESCEDAGEDAIQPEREGNTESVSWIMEVET